MDALLASRRAALELLVACLDKGQPLDEALSRHNGFPSSTHAIGPSFGSCSPPPCDGWAKSTRCWAC
jgi:hypothetical protein